MSNGIYRDFYTSKAWERVADAVRRRDHYLCVKCGAPASIVHHIIPLRKCYGTPLSLDANNLETLCSACHQAQHRYRAYKEKAREIQFDAAGNVIAAEKAEIKDGDIFAKEEDIRAAGSRKKEPDS